MRKILMVGGMLLAAGPLFGGSARAQGYSSLGLGAVMPQAELADVYDIGLTFRAQAGLSFAFGDVHLQTGVTSFTLVDDTSDQGDEATVYHAGGGVRLGPGFLWIGANGAYFFGDGDDGFGIFPEAGLRLWRLEAVADYRIDRDQQWLSARLAWRF